jgi:hypothetical protein
VTDPSASLAVNGSSITLRGSAPPNALVRIWRDPNANGLKDDGQTTPAASQQLSGGGSLFSVAPIGERR